MRFLVKFTCGDYGKLLSELRKALKPILSVSIRKKKPHHALVTGPPEVQILLLNLQRDHLILSVRSLDINAHE